MMAGSLAKPESASLGVRMPVAASASSVSIAAMSMRIFSLMNRISVTATIARKMSCWGVMGRSRDCTGPAGCNPVPAGFVWRRRLNRMSA